MIGTIGRGFAIAAAAIGGTFAISKSTTHTSALSGSLPRAVSDVKLSPTKGKETAVFAG